MDMKFIRTGLLILCFFQLFLPEIVFCEVIFEDNFNDHPDWTIDQPSGDHANTHVQEYGSGNIPTGYHSYYVLGSHYENNQHNSINIESTNARGGTGKALTFWQESDTRADSGGGWASDGDIGVLLDKEYDELYFQLYIKFQAGWRWNETGNGTGESQMKIFRVTHYHGGSPSGYFYGNQQPNTLLGLSKWIGVNSQSGYISFRYETNYFPEDATPTHSRNTSLTFNDETGNPIDGQWHRWDYYVKMNSAVGVADGIVRFWQDGVLIKETTDLAWSDDGSQENPRLKWNYFVLGGNDYNYFAENDAEEEQWYAIDDVVASTEPIGADYVIGESQSTPESAEEVTPDASADSDSGGCFISVLSAHSKIN